MGKGGGKQTTTQTTEYKIPDWVSNAGLANYGMAQQVAQGFQPVFQQAPAGFNADQLQAQEMIRNLAGSPTSSQATTDLTNRLMDFSYSPVTAASDPQFASILSGLMSGGGTAAMAAGQGASGGSASAKDVAPVADMVASQINRGDVQNVSSQMTPELLKEYLAAFDPSYQQAVIDASTSDLDRARQIAQQQNRAQAAAAGAFGGSRHGLVEAETNRGFADAAARTSADLRLQGFNTALNQLTNDQQRALQAALANQGVDLNVATQNAGFTQQAGLANQQTALQRALTNAQLGTQANIANAQFGTQASIANADNAARMALSNADLQNQRAMLAAQLGFSGLQNAADAQNRATEFTGSLQSSLLPVLGSLDQQAYNRGLTNLGLLADSGTQQQALTQAGQDVAYQNALAQQQAPLMQLGILQSALGQTPYSTSSTGESTTKYQKSLLDSLLGIGGFGLGIAGLLTK
jgi:hypothetical protein